MDQPRTMLDTLRALFDKGVRYSTVVDVGCADGQPINLESGTKVVGHNQLCLCGSGRKFKHCCGQTS